MSIHKYLRATQIALVAVLLTCSWGPLAASAQDAAAEADVAVTAEAQSAEVMDNEVAENDSDARPNEERQELGSVLFRAGSVLRVNEETRRDVVATGYQVFIESMVGGDVYAAAQDIAVNADVAGSVRAAANTVDLAATVQGSTWAAASSILVDESAVLQRGANLYGGSVVIDGTINEGLHVGGGFVTISETANVSGDVVIEGEEVVFENGAVVGSNVEVRSAKEPVVGDAVDGAENIVFTQIEQPTSKKSMKYHEVNVFGAAFGFQAVMSVFGFVAAGVLGLLGLLIFPNHFRRIPARLKEEAGKTALFGVVAVFVGPAVLFALALTVVGLPAALFFTAVLVLCWSLAKMYVAVYLMQRIVKFDFMTIKPATLYGYAALGYLGITVISLIPFLGALVAFVAGIWGVGAVLFDTWARRNEF